MEAAGQQRIVRAEDVAHMGITEVLRHAPRVYTSYRRLIRSIRRQRPSVAILIDFPDVNLRLARELKSLNIPVLYFVSPQLWAWKRSRLRWVQQRVDRMMVIFPFEAPFYRNRGVQAHFTGHPLAELPLPASTRETYAALHHLDPAKTWLALLPGSRWKEVLANLPEMLRAAALLAPDFTPPGLEILLPIASTLDPARLTAFLTTNVRDVSVKIHVLPDAREALHHARAAIVASGTATIQAAILGNPFAVVYRVSNMTYRLARHLVRYPAEIPAQHDPSGNLPIAMPNLIAGHRIVPELIQKDFSAENLASTLRPLVADTPVRTKMLADLANLRTHLLPPPGKTSIQQVCDAVNELLPPQPPANGAIPAESV